jgi:hypothetical protein
MNDEELVKEYTRTLAEVETSRGKWNRHLRAKYKLKQLHKQIVERGLTV